MARVAGHSQLIRNQPPRNRLYKSRVRHLNALHLSYLGLVNTFFNFFYFSGLAFKGKVPESP